jgi:hypothetical protein
MPLAYRHILHGSQAGRTAPLSLYASGFLSYPVPAQFNLCRSLPLPLDIWVSEQHEIANCGVKLAILRRFERLRQDLIESSKLNRIVSLKSLTRNPAIAD